MNTKDQGIANILFAGDFAPVGIPDEASVIVDPALLDYIIKMDAFFVNLEAPFTDEVKKRTKAGSNLKVPEQGANLLKKLNVYGVSLANNHIFDYGEKGVHDTLKVLNNKSLKHWGVGCNKKNACEPFIVDCNRINIAIVSFAEHEFNWISDFEWCTSMLEPAANVLQIRQLMQIVDHVIVFTHLGPENCNYPSPRQVALFRNFIDAGASAVLNSHSHSIMGMEIYKNKPIYYSLGNFFFPNKDMRKDWYNGLLVKLTFTKQEIKSDHFQVKFSDKEISIDEDIKSFQENFVLRSINLKNDFFIRQKWQEFGRQERRKLRNEVIKGIGAITLGILLQPFSQKFKELRQRGLAILRDYFTCETHVENIGNIINGEIDYS
jgi:hypothetical protein